MPPDPRLGLVLFEPASDQEGAESIEAGAARDRWVEAAAANPDWWPSVAPDRLLANERRVLAGAQGPTDRATTVARVLVLPVEFAGAETLTYRQQDASRQCVTVTHEHAGPLHGRIPYPGGSVTETIDNQTVFYPSTEPGDYARLVFGRQGYTLPLRAGDPNVNGGRGVDISGLTVQTYFDAQSDHTVAISGTVAPWVTSPHAEAYYGVVVESDALTLLDTVLKAPSDTRPGTIAGRVRNADTGAGVPGLIIRLYLGIGGVSGRIVAATSTGSDGKYSVPNVPPGSYTVDFAPPAGYLFTTSNVGPSNSAMSSNPRRSGRWLRTPQRSRARRYGNLHNQVSPKSCK